MQAAAHLLAGIDLVLQSAALQSFNHADRHEEFAPVWQMERECAGLAP